MSDSAVPQSITLPGILADITAAAGLDAALAVAKTKGGTVVYFPAQPKPDHWLSQLVGHEKAIAICAAITATRGVSLSLPMGPQSGQAERWRRIHDMLISGCSSAYVARTVGCDVSTIKRHRRKLRDDGELGHLHP